MYQKLKNLILEEFEDTREGLKLFNPFSMSKKFSIGFFLIILLFYSIALIFGLLRIPAPSWIMILEEILAILMIVSTSWIFILNLVLFFFKKPFVISAKVLQKHIGATVKNRKDLFIDEIKQKFSHDVTKMHFYYLGGRLGFRRSTEYTVNNKILDCFWTSDCGGVSIEVEEDLKISANKDSILKIINHSKEMNSTMGIFVTLLREDKIKNLLKSLKNDIKTDEISGFPFPLLIIFPLGKRDLIANLNDDGTVNFMK